MVLLYSNHHVELGKDTDDLMVPGVAVVQIFKGLSMELSHWGVNSGVHRIPPPAPCFASVISLLLFPSLRGVSLVRRQDRAQSVYPGIELHLCLVELT